MNKQRLSLIVLSSVTIISIFLPWVNNTLPNPDNEVAFKGLYLLWPKFGIFCIMILILILSLNGQRKTNLEITRKIGILIFSGGISYYCLKFLLKINIDSNISICNSGIILICISSSVMFILSIIYCFAKTSYFCPDCGTKFIVLNSNSKCSNCSSEITLPNLKEDLILYKKFIGGILIKYMIIGGLIAVLINVINYVIGYSPFLNAIISILSFVIYIFIGVSTIREFRKLNSGKVSYNQSVLTAFTNFLAILVISSIFSFILFNYIDPNYSENQKEKVIQNIEQNERMSDQMKDYTIKKINESDFSYSPKKILLGLLFGAGIYYALSLIIGMAVKKDTFESLQN